MPQTPRTQRRRRIVVELADELVGREPFARESDRPPARTAPDRRRGSSSAAHSRLGWSRMRQAGAGAEADRRDEVRRELRGGKRFREFGGSFIYPLGEDKFAIGMVVGLDYADATVSVHDLLQELKGHPFVRGMLEGGKRVAWGAKTIPEGGFLSLPERFSFPGGLVVGDAAGFVNVPALQGHPLRDRLGHARGGGGRARDRPGQTAWAPGALDSYDQSRPRRATSGPDPSASATCAPPFATASWGAVIAGMAMNTFGSCHRALSSNPTRDRSSWATATDVPEARRQALLRQALERLPVRERTRDDAPNHIRVDTKVRREVAEAWADVPGAGVRDHRRREPGRQRGRRRGDGVQLRPVRRDHGKGRRLTPPEGGTGPNTLRCRCCAGGRSREDERRSLRVARTPAGTREATRRHRAIRGRGARVSVHFPNVVALAAAAAERLLPVYTRFRERRRVGGDYEFLRAGLDSVWDALAGGSPAADLRAPLGAG